MTWDEFLKKGAEFIYGFSEKYNIENKDQIQLLNFMKEFADVYHTKMLAGEISEDQRFKRDDVKAMDYANGLLEDEEL